MTDEEAKAVGSSNMRHSHATHDLFNAIAAGDYPEWEFTAQIMDPAQQDDFEFDPLDCTKVGHQLLWENSLVNCGID